MSLVRSLCYTSYIMSYPQNILPQKSVHLLIEIKRPFLISYYLHKQCMSLLILPQELLSCHVSNLSMRHTENLLHLAEIEFKTHYISYFFQRQSNLAIGQFRATSSFIRIIRMYNTYNIRYYIHIKSVYNNLLYIIIISFSLSCYSYVD